jgi:hypothetical protein
MYLRACVAVVAGVLAVVLAGTPAAAATNWVMPLHAASAGEAQAQGLPAAPTGVTAACVSATTKEIKVTWGAVTHATSYSIYQSTTSATAGFTLVATGVTALTWTSGTLANGNYWYEVAPEIGDNWLGSTSSATAETTIKNGATKCEQP